MIKKLFSHTLIYGLAPQVATLAGIVALPIITKDLTEIDFGVWGILMAYVGALQSISLLGTNVVLSNAFFKMPKQYKWLWRQLYGFLLIWSIPFSILLGFFLYWIIPIEAQNNTFTLLALLLTPRLLFGPTANIGMYYYQLNQNPLPIAIRSVFFGLITIGLNVYTISYLKMGYMGWAWSTFIATVLMNLSYWYPVNVTLGYKPIFNFKWRTIKNALKVGLPTIPHTYSSFLLNSSDRIVMDQLSIGTGAIGQFNVAAKFGGYFRAFTSASNRAIGPMLLEAYKNKNDIKARNLIFVLQIAMLIMTFTFSLWSKEVFYILIKNNTLNKVYPLAIIIVMAYNYNPMYAGALAKLFYVEQTQLLWRVSFIAGFFNIISNIVLIPIFGFKVAAYTTFVSLMYLGFSGHFIKKIKKYNTTNYYPLYWLSLIVLLTIFVYYLVELSIFYKLIISITGIVVGSFVIFINRNRIQQFF